MDLGGLVRAVNTTYQEGAKLVIRIRDDRADTDRALPEEATRDLLDSLQTGPVLVKGQYDRDFKRYGEQLACGDHTSREQMKDVLINLQMALIVSLRTDEDLDFDALQQTSDDCRTNASVCLGQYSQRLSDVAKVEAMMSDGEGNLPVPRYASLEYSSSRSTRSTRSSGRDPRTPIESMHEASRDTVRTAKERKRAPSSASRRGYQSRRPTTPSQAPHNHQVVATTHAPTERRLRGVPSQEVLTPPDEETLRVIRNGYADAQHSSTRSDKGARTDSGYATASYASRRPGRHSNAYSMASSRSNGSAKPVHDPMPTRLPHRAKFGGISAQPMSYASRDSHDEYATSTLDDPTTSEEEDILSLRRPSSHALGPDEQEMLSPRLGEFSNRPESSARSYVVSLPDADLHEPPSPISVVSEGDEEELETDQDDGRGSRALLAADAYRPNANEAPYEFELNETTPTMGPGDFGKAIIYETSRVRRVENMPRELPPPRFRQPRQDSLSRLRESRLITTNDLRTGRSTPQRSNEEVHATLEEAEARVRHYRTRPHGLQHSGSVRVNQSSAPHAAREQEPRTHIASLQHNDRTPRHVVGLPLPPPPTDDRRPDSRSPKYRTPPGYKMFPAQTTSPALLRGTPAPPPDTALPPPPGRGPKWMAEAASTGIRPSTSPAPPPGAQRPSEPHHRPMTSASREGDLSALPEDGPGPSERDIDSPPPTAVSKTSSNGSGPRMVKIVPMHMAMYGGVYTGVPTPKAPKADKLSDPSVSKTAPPLPSTMPLSLPTEKQLLGFCKGAHRLFLGLDNKTMKISSRPIGISGNVHFWVCHKCHFQGPAVQTKTVTVDKKGKEKTKQEKTFDLKPRSSPMRGLDGELGGVRYKWVFLAKCHVPLKAMTEELALGAGAAGRGEWGGFGCLFCCAEGQSRGWTDRDARGKLVVADGLSIMSGSTGSGDTAKSSSSGGAKDTPLFKDLESFMSHLEMHRKEDCWPGQEMLGRMRCVVGRRAQDGEGWEINFLPLKSERPEDA